MEVVWQLWSHSRTFISRQCYPRAYWKHFMAKSNYQHFILGFHRNKMHIILIQIFYHNRMSSNSSTTSRSSFRLNRVENIMFLILINFYFGISKLFEALSIPSSKVSYLWSGILILAEKWERHGEGRLRSCGWALKMHL